MASSWLASCDDGGGIVLWTQSDGDAGSDSRQYTPRVLDWGSNNSHRSSASTGEELRTTHSSTAKVGAGRTGDSKTARYSWLAIAFSPDSRILACAGVDQGDAAKAAGVARTISTDSSGVAVGPDLRHNGSSSGAMTSLAWIPEPELLLATGTQSGAVLVWDFMSGEVRWQLRHAVGPQYSSVRLLDWVHPSVREPSETGGCLVAVLCAANGLPGDAAAVAARSSGYDSSTSSRVTFFYRNTVPQRRVEGDTFRWTSTERPALSVGDAVGRGAVRAVHQGKIAARFNSAGMVELYDTSNNTVTLTLNKDSRASIPSSGVSTALEFSPDGNKLVGTRGVVWDTRTGEAAFHLQTKRGDSFSKTSVLRWSPEGKRLATATAASPEWQNIVRLWDMVGPETVFGEPAGRCLAELECEEGHGSQRTVTDLAWGDSSSVSGAAPPRGDDTHRTSHVAMSRQTSAATGLTSPHRGDSTPLMTPFVPTTPTTPAGTSAAVVGEAPGVGAATTPMTTTAVPVSAAESPSLSVQGAKELRKLLKEFKMMPNEPVFKAKVSLVIPKGRDTLECMSQQQPEAVLQELRALLVRDDNTTRSAVRRREDKLLIAGVVKKLLNVDVGEGSKPMTVVDGEDSSSSPELKSFMGHYADTWIKAAALAFVLLELMLKRKSDSIKRQQKREQARKAAQVIYPPAQCRPSDDDGPKPGASHGPPHPPPSSNMPPVKEETARPVLDRVTAPAPVATDFTEHRPKPVASHGPPHPPPSSNMPPVKEETARPVLDRVTAPAPVATDFTEHRPQPSSSSHLQDGTAVNTPPVTNLDVKTEPMDTGEAGTQPFIQEKILEQALSAPPAVEQVGGAERKNGGRGGGSTGLGAESSSVAGTKRAASDVLTMESGESSGMKAQRVDAATANRSMKVSASDDNAELPVVKNEEDLEESRERSLQGSGIGGGAEADSDVEDDAVVQGDSNARAKLSRAETDYVPILSIDLPESEPQDEDGGEGPNEVPAVTGKGDIEGETGGRVTSPVVFPKQKEVASELLLKMERQIGNGGVEFDQLAFFIQVPNLNSLLGQTLTRVGEFLEAHRAVDSAFFPDLTPEEVVYKGAPASSWVAMFESVKERIRMEPKTLFLFIHDEAHWSPTTGTAGYFINDDLLRRSSNVFTLFVSATPYNLLTQDSQVPMENEHQWFTPNEATNYYGLQRYLEPQGQGDGGAESSTATAASSLRGCLPGAIVKDTLLYNAASTRMALPQTLREAWLTGKHAEAGVEDETAVNKSAQLRKLKMLLAVEVRYAAAFLQAMGRLPSELPAGAALRMPDGSPLPALPDDDLTLEMVRRLVSPGPNGRGIMILLRVADQKSGRLLYNSMRRMRGFLGLQTRIAVIIDINQTEARSDDNSFGLKETIEAPLLKRLLRLQIAAGLVGPEADAPVVRQYSDLDGLPCILILCEKGKMGDTFPPSLRYYDLRLRYISSCNERAATEQDLGRAFRYHDPTVAGTAELPTILVSQQLHSALMGKRGGRRGLLRYDPARPDLMRSVGGKKFPDQKGPHPESDSSAYRAHWAAGPKHFDHKQGHAGAEGCWVANPRRFVLAAAPQIGKTGAFLHLIYLLWCRYLPCHVVEPTPPDRIAPDAGGLGDHSSSDPQGTPHPACMAMFPNSMLLTACPFSPSGHQAGKYGDPSRASEYEWYMAGNRGRYPFATPAAAVEDEAREGLLPLRFSAQPSLVAMGGAWAGRSAEVRLPVGLSKENPLEGMIGRLHIPHTHDVANAWLPGFPASIRIQPPAAPSPGFKAVLRTPIFVPSKGRPAAALLDWTDAMIGWEYLQIVVVKSEELQSYMAHWPGHIFFELPPQASELGIGAARFVTLFLAAQMVEGPNAGGRRCAYVLDDRVLAWKVDTGLRGDRHAEAMQSLATACSVGSDQRGNRLMTLPMGVALSFMEQPGCDLAGVAVVGFRSYGGGPVSWGEAYARSSVGSAVLLNLTELAQAKVIYDPAVFAWEDIDLSRRASGQGRSGMVAATSPGLVVAECRRFVVIKKIIAHGGCGVGADVADEDIELEDVSISNDGTEWQLEDEEDRKVALGELSHLQVGRLVEWALGRVWGAVHQRAAQHVAARRVAALGLDGSVLADNDDIVDELASELKGASRRAALREAIDAVKASGGVEQWVVDAWDAVPVDQPLPPPAE